MLPRHPSHMSDGELATWIAHLIHDRWEEGPRLDYKAFQGLDKPSDRSVEYSRLVLGARLSHALASGSGFVSPSASSSPSRGLHRARISFPSIIKLHPRIT